LTRSCGYLHDHALGIQEQREHQCQQESKHHPDGESYIQYVSDRLIGIYKDMQDYGISTRDLNAKSGITAAKSQKKLTQLPPPAPSSPEKPSLSTEDKEKKVEASGPPAAKEAGNSKRNREAHEEDMRQQMKSFLVQSVAETILNRY